MTAIGTADDDLWVQCAVCFECMVLTCGGVHAEGELQGDVPGCLLQVHRPDGAHAAV